MRRWKDKTLDSLDAKKLWKNGLTYLVLFLAVGAMTFFGVCDPSGSRRLLPSGDAANVANFDITSSDFKRAYRNAYSRYQTQLKDRFDPKALQLSSRVMDQLVNDYIMFAEATRSGISTKEFELSDFMLQIPAFKNKDGLFDSKLLKTYLRNAGYTEKSFEDEIKMDLTSRKLRDFLSTTMIQSDLAAKWQYRLSETKLDIDFIKIDKQKVDITISDQDIKTYLGEEKNKQLVKEYFNSHKSEFNTPKMVRAYHILNSYKGARNASGEGSKRTKEEAKARAEALLKDVKNGSDFIELAKLKSDEPTAKEKSGDLGFFKYEDMVKEFSEAAFKLKAGEVSGVVPSPFGFHIIKVVGIKDEIKQTLEQAEKSIAKKNLKKTEQPKAVEELTKRILAELKAGENASQALKSAQAEWQSTGEFSFDARFIPSLGSSEQLKSAALSLKKPGDLHEGSIDVSGNHYILRLKSFKEADLTKLTKEELSDLKDSKRFLESYTFYAAFTKLIQEDYKKRGLVRVNSEYRDLSLNSP